MILNLKKKNFWNIFKRIYNFMAFVRLDLLKRRTLKKLFRDSKQLQRLYYKKYPILNKSEEGNILCVSCGLCEDICPVDSIKIEKSGMFNLPTSPTQGAIPAKFILDVETCNKCNLCSIVCAVDAIELKGNFEASKIDLVKEIS